MWGLWYHTCSCQPTVDLTNLLLHKFCFRCSESLFYSWLTTAHIAFPCLKSSMVWWMNKIVEKKRKKGFKIRRLKVCWQRKIKYLNFGNVYLSTWVAEKFAWIPFFILLSIHSPLHSIVGQMRFDEPVVYMLWYCDL